MISSETSAIGCNPFVLHLVKECGQHTEKGLCVNIILDALRIADGAPAGMIILHNGAHLGKVFGFGDDLFLVERKGVPDPLGEAVIIGGILVALLADASGHPAAVFSFLGTAAQDGGTRTGNGCSGEVGGYVIQLHVT